MPFVISGGQLAPVRPPLLPAFPTGVYVADGVFRDYAEIWKSQPQVRTVVSFLARNIAQLGLHTFRRVTDTDRERLIDHPLAVLLGRPTPWTTTYRFVDALISDLAIFDNAITVKIKTESQTTALQRIDPRMVCPKGDSPFTPDAYEIRGPRGKRLIPADQVIHWRGYNPDDARWGTSPMETLRAILAEEFAAAQYRAQLWRNSARVSGYLRRPADAPKWQDGAKDRFRESWQAQYAGNGPLAGGTPILEDGMDFMSASSSARDAQYIESRKLTREEVASAYHIPLPMVGILDHATFSNIKEQHKQLYQDCLGPWLEMIQQEIELQLLPDFADTSRVYVEFNLEAKMRGSFEEQAAQIQTSVGAPWMTRNEGRALVNLPSIEGGDELITPLNVLMGNPAAPDDDATAEGGGDPTMSAEDVAKRVGAAASLIRSGFAPEAALLAVGLNPIDHLGLLPVTVQRPSEPDNVDESLQDALKSRTVSVKARAPKAHEGRAEKLFRSFFNRQAKVVKSRMGGKSMKDGVTDVFDTTRWNTELTADLFRLNLIISLATAHSLMAEIDEDSDEYDEERTKAWLMANAEGTAESVNATTKDRLAEALKGDDAQQAVSHLFEVFATARAAQIAKSQVTSISGFATTEAARQTAERTGGKATKTWRVRSSNPRPSHARLDGKTIGLEEKFANGAAWPGDRNTGPDERAGCECDLEINFP